MTDFWENSDGTINRSLRNAMFGIGALLFLSLVLVIWIASRKTIPSCGQMSVIEGRVYNVALVDRKTRSGRYQHYEISIRRPNGGSWTGAALLAPLNVTVLQHYGQTLVSRVEWLDGIFVRALAYEREFRGIERLDGLPALPCVDR